MRELLMPTENGAANERLFSSPYASFIAAYVCDEFFLINNEILPPHVIPGVKFGTFDITAISVEFFACFRTIQNRRCSYYR